MPVAYHMILGSWGGMKKYLEKDMLCASLKGRVQYDCTEFDGSSSTRRFEVRVDGRVYARFYFLGLCKYAPDHNPFPLIDAGPHDRDVFCDTEFAAALKEYRSLPVQETLAHENPIVRMFAVVDRRVGQRTLSRLASTLPEQPLWLQPFYRLRLEAVKRPCAGA